MAETELAQTELAQRPQDGVGQTELARRIGGPIFKCFARPHFRTVRQLLRWLLDGPLRGSDRTEMLVQRDTVRPGVLVLVNDTDWEILGGLDAQLEDGDTVTFISTLHGG
uniref:Ubiquitin-related modifier 1 homolog n=1 Tax=Globodera pallida TaxID=36090 RepID=A0A183C640_GLOPA